MNSNRQKKDLLRKKRKEEKTKEFQKALRDGSILPVDESKIVSRSALPTIPRFYQDREFECRDCGRYEVWTAKRQKWWYEEAGGEIETIAIRCKDCREKERERKVAVRKAQLEGIAKKNGSANAEDPMD